MKTSRTPFTRQNLVVEGHYVMYVGPDHKREFVARFKTNAGLKRRFVTHLIRHWTVESYFEMLGTVNPDSALGNKYAPLEIAMSSGLTIH